MTAVNLFKAEIRKLTTTRMPLAFLVVLVAISVTTAIAVIFGTDFDGSKGFISTAADQLSLMAFAGNAMMIAGLFGAVAVAREFAHKTVVPTYLGAPRRHRAVLAQLAAVFVGGGVIGLVGAGLTVGGVALSLLATDFGFLVSTSAVAQLIAASTFAGAAGAVLGAGIGAVVRNPGGAVTGAVLALVIIPPLIVQLANGAASWVPTTLNAVVSGTANQVSIIAAIAALAAWALVPAAIGLVSIQRRDVI